MVFDIKRFLTEARADEELVAISPEDLAIEMVSKHGKKVKAAVARGEYDRPLKRGGAPWEVISALKILARGK